MALSLARGLPPRHVLLDGSLTVTVTSATDLPAMDRVSGRSDPFVYIIINGEKVARTKKMANTLRPEWDQTFELDIVGAKSLDFRVMDYDRMTTNDYCAMVRCMLVTSSIASMTSFFEWRPDNLVVGFVQPCSCARQ